MEPMPLSPLAAALNNSGAAAYAEVAKARETERELRWKIHTLETELRDERAEMAALQSLFVVRAFRAWQRWK